MNNTFTFTARNVEKINQVITFTLQNHHMVVSSGPFQETIEAALDQIGESKQAKESEESESMTELWLKPIAVSLFERGMGKFHINDVNAKAEDEYIRVRAWYRVGGLAFAPITLMDGRVDNPQAAQAFVKELNTRKSEVKGKLEFLKVLDFWFTWILLGTFLVGFLRNWLIFKNKGNKSD